MKKSKTYLWALTIGTGIALAVSAEAGSKTPAPPPLGTNYTLNAVITNVPPPVVATITGPPLFACFASNSAFGVVYTDGRGKIDGIEDLVFTNLDLCPPLSQGDFVTQIGGSITTSGRSNNVVVTMTMKGNGYVQDDIGSTQRQSGLNLNFVGRLFPSNSVANLSTTNTFLYIGTNFGDTLGFTNEYAYLLETNYTFRGGYQTLDMFYYTEQSLVSPTNTVNGTNTTLVQDSICSADCLTQFGTPTGTTNVQVGAICFGNCTTLFTNVVIGTNITYQSQGTNIVTARTNYIYGIDSSNLPAWMAAITNCIATNGTGFVQIITAAISNVVAATSSTNIYTYAHLTQIGGSGRTRTNSLALSFSNGWFEVDGVLKGQITAGRCRQSFNNTNAVFSGSFTNFTTFLGSGSNTSGPYFGSNPGALWIAANDSGVLYVVSEFVPGSGDLSAVTPFGALNATVKQFGNNIWISSPGFGGTGAQNPKKGTYKVNMAGAGRLNGSSLVVTGATGIDIVGYEALTNITLLTNLASVPPVTGFATNTSFFGGSACFTVPTQTVGGQFVGGGDFDYFSLITNGVGTTNIVVTNVTICCDLYLPPIIVTNTVDCIRTFFGNGRVLGQKVSGSGTNADVPFPN